MSTWSVFGDGDVDDLDGYVATGGGAGLRAAVGMDAQEVIDLIARARLRGRGGAGYPVADKWRTVRAAAHRRGDPAFVVANGAEGEPGSAKDRLLMRRRPLAVVEGLLVALYAVGAREGVLAVTERETTVAARLQAAVEQSRRAGWAGADRITVVRVPDAYLAGEETALLEVLEGRPALPRVQRPDQFGLGAGPRRTNPTVVSNVETLAHVARLVQKGPDDFLACGTPAAPGTMGFTVTGDVPRPGVQELPLGTPLRVLLDRAGAGDVQAVAAGSSGGLLPPEALGTRLDFDAMRAVGGALGSGGFIVLGPSRCIVQVLDVLVGFLAEASCGQCLACSGGTHDIAGALARIERGAGGERDLERIRTRAAALTDRVRCGLPAGAQRLVAGALRHFAPEIDAHLEVACRTDRPLDLDELAAGDDDASQ